MCILRAVDWCSAACATVESRRKVAMGRRSGQRPVKLRVPRNRGGRHHSRGKFLTVACRTRSADRMGRRHRSWAEAARAELPLAATGGESGGGTAGEEPAGEVSPSEGERAGHGVRLRAHAKCVKVFT